MAITAPEPDSLTIRGVCPFCGRGDQGYAPPALRVILVNALAAILVGTVLVSVGVFVWNWSTRVLSERMNHSIFARPLENWQSY